MIKSSLSKRVVNLPWPARFHPNSKAGATVCRHPEPPIDAADPKSSDMIAASGRSSQ
jgi:hypothetical protein